MKKIGLTLGKFAPLHKGHQSVIERAIQETDHLYVMIYDSPQVTTVPLQVRAGWIRKLYPEVEVIEAYHGPTEVGDSPEIKKLNEDYILKTLGDRKVTHFYSSEFYGDHVSRALGAADCRVDPERGQIPISATQIRSNPFHFREFISPVVYRDLVTWVVFVGAPSTGKTTLVEGLAKKYATVWMPEYGREYWQNHQRDRRLSLEQLLEIAEGHRKREELLVQEANQFFFVDTDASTTRIFSKYYHGAVHPMLDRFADEVQSRYDLHFLCEDDIPFDDTSDRSGEGSREWFQDEIRRDLIARGIDAISLRGSVEQRISEVERVLNSFDTWSVKNS